MLTIILTVVALVVILYYYIYKPMNYWKDLGVAQGKPRWLFGHCFGVLVHTEVWAYFVQRMYNQSPGTRYTGMYHLNYPILVIKDIDLLKQVCVKDFDHFTDRITFLPADADPLFSANLFSLLGKQWREMRALLTPSFTSAKMRSVFLLINESAQNFTDYFLKKEEDVMPVEMKDIFSRFSSDVIATAACGLKVNSLEHPDNEFYKMGLKSINIDDIWINIKLILYRMIPPISKVLKIQLINDDVSKFFCKLMDETIKLREENGIVRPDMVHLLLEAKKEIEKEVRASAAGNGHESAKESTNVNERAIKTLTNVDITSQVLTFFVAGFDSVASTTSFTTYELALHPDIQQRLRDEIWSTWETCKGKLTYEALSKMKYMDMVVSESLRKWPNNVAMNRVCTKPYTIDPVHPGEVPIHLKVGDPIWLPIFAVQRDPENFPDPERFDPERFSEENKGSIKPYSFMAFGIGPRNCIGSRFALMETKIILFYILLKFEVVPIEKTPIPLKLCKKSFFLSCEGGFWVGFKKWGRDVEQPNF